MLFAALFISVSRLIAQNSGTIERTLPPGLIVAWYAMLAIGSFVALSGVFWREPLAGLLIERAGLLFLIAATVIYSFALLYAAGFRGAAAASFVVAFAAASSIRAIDIGRILVRIRAVAVATGAVLDEGEESKE
jgi:hypothetical protein